MLGIGWYVALVGFPTGLGDEAIAGRIRNDLRSPCALLLVSLACLVISGNPPGVLFLVTCRCSRGLSFSLHFAIGLRNCIIAGASVMRGMVSIAVLSNIPLLILSRHPLFILSHPLFILDNVWI